MNSRRIASLRRHLKAHRLDALIVTSIPHIRYISGFTGSNALCVFTNSYQVLITDSRYDAQVREEVKGFRLIISEDGLFPELAARKVLSGKIRVGFQDQDVSYAIYQNLQTYFPKCKFIPAADLIERIVTIKEKNEIDLIRNAVKITDLVFHRILSRLKADITELDVAAEITYLHRKMGAEGDAFDPIVASGVRSSLPHARASNKRLQHGDLVILDFGCRYQGYHSDLTRTVAVGEISKEKEKIYQTVLDAQKRAIDAARDGIPVQKLDFIARYCISKAGFAKYFKHSLGHGIGLQVHELPKISALSEDNLTTGNVVTIEPGIYIPGLGGVRIEDDIVIKEGGCEVLNNATKDLLIV